MRDYAPKHIAFHNYGWLVDIVWAVYDAADISTRARATQSAPLSYVFHLVMDYRFSDSRLSALRADIAEVCSSIDSTWSDSWDITVLGNDTTLLYPVMSTQTGGDIYSVSIIFSRKNG